jgi:hypothetical protein
VSGDLFGDKILHRRRPFLQTFLLLSVLKWFAAALRFASGSCDSPTTARQPPQRGMKALRACISFAQLVAGAARIIKLLIRLN